jgi:SAM-dependent methyltransferase
LSDLLSIIRNPHYCNYFFKDRKIRKQVRNFLHLFVNKNGLEIGGGTYLFHFKIRGMPIYSVAKSIDNCNFGKISSQNILFAYRNKILGKQFYGDAIDIKSIVHEKYDFIISCHCLEHIANPVKALKNWTFLLNDKGILLSVLPNKENNFDHNRNYTSFSHIKDDFLNDEKEDSLFHLNEVVNLFDFRKFQKDKDAILVHLNNNPQTRHLHHHVFTKDCLIEIYKFLSIDVLFCEKDYHNIYIIGQKNENTVQHPHPVHHLRQSGYNRTGI